MVFLFLNPIQHNNTIQFKRKRRLRKQDDQSESVRTIEISGSRYGFSSFSIYSYILLL